MNGSRVGFLFQHDYPPDPFLDSRTQNLKRLLAKEKQPQQSMIRDCLHCLHLLWTLLTAKESI